MGAIRRDADGRRMCRLCHQTKPLREFYRNGLQGYRTECADCNRVVSARWQRAKRQRLREEERALYTSSKAEREYARISRLADPTSAVPEDALAFLTAQRR